MAKTVLGIFADRADAEDAINELSDDGYDPKDISIVLKDQREGEELSDNTGANVASGTVSGLATGAVLGGLAGLVASIAIPGLGAFFIGGPIAAALGITGAAAATVSGAATGAVAGGIVGALTSFGLSEEEARVYEDHVKSGAILVAVPARRGEEGRVEQILDEYNADDIRTVSSDEERERYEEGEGRGFAFTGLKGGRSRTNLRRRRARSRRAL